MLSNQVLAQSSERINVVNRELNYTSSKRYLHLYFIQANFEVWNLGIFAEVEDLNGRKYARY